jgi:glyoxylate/hydroxypyruvate reductase A
MALLFCSSDDGAAEWAAEIHKHIPDLDIREFPALGEASEIEAALVWHPPHGLLASLPRLRLILSLGAGVDFILSDPSLPPEVPILRLVDPYMTTAMCEYVEWQVLRLHRQDYRYAAQQREGRWQPLPQPNAAERRVGILGLGALGSEAALHLKVLGFDVAGWSRSERRIRGIPCFHGPDGLDALLARSEILICLLPLTAATENILDARLFAKLPRGAAIINCARGQHLKEEDLVPALDRGELACAVLDVFRSEPLPPDHPFWHDPRIAITPHVAGATNKPTAAVIYADALRLLWAGKPIPNLVERARGY